MQKLKDTLNLARSLSKGKPIEVTVKVGDVFSVTLSDLKFDETEIDMDKEYKPTFIKDEKPQQSSVNNNLTSLEQVALQLEQEKSPALVISNPIDIEEKDSIELDREDDGELDPTRQLLKRHAWKLSTAAQILRVSEPTIRRLVKLGLVETLPNSNPIKVMTESLLQNFKANRCRKRHLKEELPQMIYDNEKLEKFILANTVYELRDLAKALSISPIALKRWFEEDQIKIEFRCGGVYSNNKHDVLCITNDELLKFIRKYVPDYMQEKFAVTLPMSAAINMDRVVAKKDWVL